MSQVSQETFRSVYQKRDSALHRSSYMRLGKTYAIHAALEEHGVELEAQRIFDFGFGPGNFLISCPPGCHLAGCEIDPVHVEALAGELERRGQRSVALRVASEESSDYAAPFEGERFDIIVMSHVLEHIEHPEEVLRAARGALTEGGIIVVILPINELRPDPRHCHEVTVAMARSWFEMADLEVPVCRELGWVNYVVQPHLKGEGPVGRLVAQGLGLSVGLVSRLFSPGGWWKCTDRLGSKRGQLILVGEIGNPDSAPGRGEARDLGDGR